MWLGQISNVTAHLRASEDTWRDLKVIYGGDRVVNKGLVSLSDKICRAFAKLWLGSCVLWDGGPYGLVRLLSATPLRDQALCYYKNAWNAILAYEEALRAGTAGLLSFDESLIWPHDQWYRQVLLRLEATNFQLDPGLAHELQLVFSSLYNEKSQEDLFRWCRRGQKLGDNYYRMSYNRIFSTCQAGRQTLLLTHSFSELVDWLQVLGYDDAIAACGAAAAAACVIPIATIALQACIPTYTCVHACA